VIRPSRGDEDESVMRKNRCLSLLLVALVAGRGVTAWAQGEGKTLREVLVGQHLPLGAERLPNLEKTITSGAELNDAAQFVIAYYVNDGSGLLKQQLYLDRYERKTGKWQSAALGDAKTESRNMDVNCLGSVLNITSFGARLFLDTHLTPSAGCVLVLSQDLRFQAGLYGWLVGHLGDDRLIYQRSQVHFAPVHSTEIALYDLSTKRDLTIFPPKPDPTIRKARIGQMEEFYKTHEKWCMENNDPCDPEEFDSSLAGEVVSDQREHALAFIISYRQIQVFRGDQKPEGPEEVVYVYRHVDDEKKMEYREMLWREVDVRVGSVPLEKLVEPEILEKIFGQDPPKTQP